MNAANSEETAQGNYGASRKMARFPYSSLNLT